MAKLEIRLCNRSFRSAQLAEGDVSIHTKDSNNANPGSDQSEQFELTNYDQKEK